MLDLRVVKANQANGAPLCSTIRIQELRELCSSHAES